MALANVSLGVAGALGPDRIATIGAAAEAAGFYGLWVNDTPAGDSLAALAAASRKTSNLRLGTGVIPVDRRPAADILRDVRSAEISEGRLTLGIGSGGTRTGALAMVRDAVTTLRQELSSRILVGALQPRMRLLAAKDAHGPLLSWLTPEIAAVEAAEAHALTAGVDVVLYIRAAVEPEANARLVEEATNYGGYSAYAANFARLGVSPHDTVLDPDGFDNGIRAYRAAVDEVVLRAITPSDEIDDYLRFIDIVASRLLVGD